MKSNIIAKNALILLNPFLGFIYFLKSFNSFRSISGIPLMCGFFASQMPLLEKADITRYYDRYMDSTLEGWETLFGRLDFIQPLSAAIFSKLSLNFEIYLFGVGVLYGYILTKNFKLLFVENYSSRNSVVFAFLLFLIIPVWGINVMRFTLASLLCVQELLTYKPGSKVPKMMIASVFIHSSMLLCLLVYLISLVLRKKRIILFLGFAYLISVIVYVFQIQLIKIEFLGIENLVLDKYQGYFNADWIEYRNSEFEKTNFKAKIHKFSLHIGVALLLILNLKKVSLKIDESHRQPLIFSLLLLIIANLSTFTPTMARYAIIGHYLALAALIMYKSQTKQRLNLFGSFIATPFLLAYSAISLKIGLTFTGVGVIVGNFFSLIFLPKLGPILY